MRDAEKSARAYRAAQNSQCERGDFNACKESDCSEMQSFDSSLWNARRPDEFLQCARRMRYVSGNFWTIPKFSSPIGESFDPRRLNNGDIFPNEALLLCFRKRGPDQKVLGRLYHIVEYQTITKQNGIGKSSFTYAVENRNASRVKAKEYSTIGELAETVCER